MDLIIHTDGGSRGNPGEGAVGVVIEKFEIRN
ncbi:ribonuclease HI, partial [Candidatus Roizmanbacteria bacterium]|nr:ribonuclease HI [Candidatus Roizmanbacteria bacterium]